MANLMSIMPGDTEGVEMGTLLAIFGLINQIRALSSNGDSRDYHKEFRDYWLDPNYSFLRSDSKEFFGSGFDWRV